MSNQRIALFCLIFYTAIGVLYLLLDVVAIINGESGQNSARTLTMGIIFYLIYDLYKTKKGD